MTLYSELIGKQIISLDSGVGNVVGYDDLGMEGNNFLVIEYGKDRAKNYVNLEGKKNFREILSHNEFNKCLDSVSSLDKFFEFESKQERINFFKTESREEDVEKLLTLLLNLQRLTDLGSVEVQIFDRIMESLSLELSIISDQTMESTKEIILKTIEDDENDE